MPWLLNGILILSGSVLGLITAGVYFLQEKLLYLPDMPTRTLEEMPEEYGLTYEDVQFEASDKVKLHGWLITQSTPAATREAPTLIYFHGNAGNISHRLPDVRHLINQVNCNVFMVSYRGYGRSQGKPTELGLIRDAEAAFRYVLQHPALDRSKLFAFGKSVGGAVAFSLAARHEEQLAGIIVENTFLSINEMIDALLPALRPFKFLNRNTWNNVRRIENLQLPILFLSSLDDEIVPSRHMRELYHAAKGTHLKKLELFENATHNDTWYMGGPRYLDTISEFIEQAFQQRRAVGDKHESVDSTVTEPGADSQSKKTN
ncbi:Protein ABHD13 [Porphyridium purpureum]|uniref:Protein ABHD13 n=1 Tax=Porphyridium purpureum TaxID=35688 RepID=A0A5J4Z729_PORPP|nr:Protein ABHD13 [Porphyridium purpureum]|eukprot:POR5259..scf295_1